jgi:hypothetical protein
VTARRDVPVVLGIWLLTAAGQASVGPVTEVKIVGGRVHIQATAASVSEVLDRLSRTTGMKIVYEGAPPSDRLTAAIDAPSETEALSRLFEGLGLTYAFKLDVAGRHVETLFVTNSSSRRASVGTTANSNASPRMAQLAVEDDATDQAPENEPVPEPPSVASPTSEAAGMGTTNPGYSGPGYAGGQVSAGVPAAEEQNPAFPSGASFPTPGSPAPANPAFPSFPGPASFP